MADSRYAPPKAKVADLAPKRPTLWGRAVWLHLPVFAALVFIVFGGLDLPMSGLAFWGVAAGLALTGALLYFPVRALCHMSEEPPPWWTDFAYYASVAVCIAGFSLEDANIIVAGGAPTVLLNGVLGIGALVIEKRRKVRIYVSGRRYIFLAPSAL